MENYILNRKPIILEKNKEFLFRIPVAFKPIDCDFIIETFLAYTITESLVLTFSLKGIKGGAENKVTQIPVFINSSYTKCNLYNLHQELENEEYLLIGCFCDNNISISLSILRNYERFVG